MFYRLCPNFMLYSHRKEKISETFSPKMSYLSVRGSVIWRKIFHRHCVGVEWPRWHASTNPKSIWPWFFKLFSSALFYQDWNNVVAFGISQFSGLLNWDLKILTTMVFVSAGPFEGTPNSAGCIEWLIAKRRQEVPAAYLSSTQGRLLG